MGGPKTAPGLELDDTSLVAAIRAGDERAFEALVSRHHTSLLRVARTHVPSDAVAEEVVQETWLGVLEGIDRFEGRSSLKTWIFRILLNIARTRGAREHRTIPATALAGTDGIVPDDWFHPVNGGTWGGWWVLHPARWDGLPEDRAAARELRQLVARAIEDLPTRQRQVIVLRDVEQFSSNETCALLNLTEGNQRVLLHRARSTVRQALQAYFEPDAAGPDDPSGRGDRTTGTGRDGPPAPRTGAAEDLNRRSPGGRRAHGGAGRDTRSKPMRSR